MKSRNPWRISMSRLSSRNIWSRFELSPQHHPATRKVDSNHLTIEMYWLSNSFSASSLRTLSVSTRLLPDEPVDRDPQLVDLADRGAFSATDNLPIRGHCRF